MLLFFRGVWLVECGVRLLEQVRRYWKRCDLVFVSFADRELNFATFVAQLGALNAESILIKNILLGSLSFLRGLVVYEEVRPVLGVLLGLFHPDCAHFAILAEDLLDHGLGRQLRVDRERDEKGAAVLRGQVIIWQVARNASRPFGVIRKLYFYLGPHNF